MPNSGRGVIPEDEPLSLYADEGAEMGILDEAIREHLELKRQHGAPENEVKDLEDEAFGAPARPGDLEDVAVPEAEAPHEAEPETASEPEPTLATEPPTPTPEAVEPPPVEPEPAALEEEPSGPEEVVEQPTEFYDVEGELAEAGAGQGEVPESAEEDSFFSDQSLSDELDSALGEVETESPPVPEEPAEPEAPGAPEAPTAPPAEPEEPPAEGEGAPFDQEDDGEDVLEETPEFLQDTPEHDRLWFEQKPPKDFDFDD